MVHVETNDTFSIVPKDTYDTSSIIVNDMYRPLDTFSEKVQYCIGISNDSNHRPSIVRTVHMCTGT